MKPISGPKKARIIVVPFLFPILLFAIGGCKKDSSSSTAPDVAYPAVAGQWSGVVDEGTVIHDVTWPIVQNANLLSGTSLWITRSGGQRTDCKFVGTINMNRQVALRETSYVPYNWSGSGWSLASYTGVLNKQGDSLFLSWTVGGGGGTFVLTKK